MKKKSAKRTGILVFITSQLNRIWVASLITSKQNTFPVAMLDAWMGSGPLAPPASHSSVLVTIHFPLTAFLSHLYHLSGFGVHRFSLTFSGDPQHSRATGYFFCGATFSFFFLFLLENLGAFVLFLSPQIPWTAMQKYALEESLYSALKSNHFGGGRGLFKLLNRARDTLSHWGWVRSGGTLECN